MSRFYYPYSGDGESDGDYEANKDVEGYEDVDVNEDAEREACEILEEETFHSSSISNVKEGYLSRQWLRIMIATYANLLGS